MKKILFLLLSLSACTASELPTISQYVMDERGNILKLVYCDCPNTRVYCFTFQKVDTTQIKIKTFDHLKIN
jgi:hypothetical protein